MSLKVLCDENLPGAVISALKEWKFNVVVAEPGTTDEEISAKAKREELIIVTFDSDFANILKYPPKNFSGIIRINIRPPLIKTVINALKTLFNAFKTPEEFCGKLFIVEATTFRIWEESVSE